MSAEVRPWNVVLMRIGKNGPLEPFRPRTSTDIEYIENLGTVIHCRWMFPLQITRYIKVLCRLRTANHRCPQQYEFLLKDHLGDPSLARAWTKSDIGPWPGVHHGYSPKRDPHQRFLTKNCPQ